MTTRFEEAMIRGRLHAREIAEALAVAYWENSHAKPGEYVHADYHLKLAINEFDDLAKTIAVIRVEMADRAAALARRAAS